MQYPSLPVGAFLAAALVLVPLPWHWRARNVGTLSIITWLFVVNIIYGINAIVWNTNVDNPAPVWCDITTKLIIGANIALPLATMCVCKHLELVSSNRQVRFDHIDKQRRIIFDAAICFGIPLIFMALHCIVQGHRYDIVENFGCQPTTYFSIQGIIVVWLPPLVFATVTLIYAALSLYHFACRRMNFAAHIQNASPALTTQRYLRLMAMAVTEIVWGTALTAFNLYNNAGSGLRPWISWQNVHSDWLRVDLFAFIELPPSLIKSMFLLWWAMPASAYIFFLFFGFSNEARREYGKIITAFRKHVLRQSTKDISFHGSNLPSARHRGPKITPLPLMPLADDNKLSNERSSSRSTQIPFRPPRKFNHVTFPNASDILPPKYAPDIEAGLSDDSHSDQMSESLVPWGHSSHQPSQQPSLSYDCPHPYALTTSIVVGAGPKPSHPYARPWSPPTVASSQR